MFKFNLILLVSLVSLLQTQPAVSNSGIFFSKFKNFQLSKNWLVLSTSQSDLQLRILQQQCHGVMWLSARIHRPILRIMWFIIRFWSKIFFKSKKFLSIVKMLVLVARVPARMEARVSMSWANTKVRLTTIAPGVITIVPVHVGAN